MSETTDKTARRRRIGKAEDWPIPSELNDPQLGLTYEQLSERFRESGLPEGWSPAFAAELAEAAHAVISRQIGKMSRGRVRWNGVTSALAGICTAERWLDADGAADEEDVEEFSAVAEADDVLLVSPFPELADVQPLLRADPVAGWGSGAGGLRRLYEYGQICGPFCRHGKRRQQEQWALRTADDHGTLDTAWATEARARRRRARLPVPACAAFAAPSRSLELAATGTTIELPSVWQLVATVLLWGADEARARQLEFLDEEAAREVAPRADRPDGGKLADSSLRTTAAEAHSWLLRCYEVAAAYPHLRERWERKPEAVSLAELEQTVTVWRATRTAVPLLLYRRRRASLIAEVERNRRRDGTLDPKRSLRALKRLCFYLLLGETSARLGELARIAPCHVIDRFELEGYITPAVVIAPSKTGRRYTQQPQTRAINDDTLRYLLELIALCALDRSDPQPLWMAHFVYSPNDRGSYDVTNRRTGPRMRSPSLASTLIRSVKGTAVPLIARPGGGSFAAHSYRHMGEQVAYGVGTDYLRAHEEWQTRISVQAFPDAQLGHRPTATDVLGYKDFAADRPLWALRVALGDPQRGVPGLLALLASDAGARRGWDIDAIRAARLQIALAQRHLNEAAQEVAALRLERRAVCQRRLPAVPPDLSTLTIDEAQQLMLARDVAREANDRDRDRLDDQLDVAYDARQTVAEAVRASEAALEALRRRGKTFPLPDDLPTRAELDPETDPYPLDEETWEQALDRGTAKLELLAPIESVTTPTTRVRNHLNMAEFGQGVLGLSDGAVRSNIRRQTWFPADGADSPLIVIGDKQTSKLRFIDVDRLPANLLARLLPEQREVIDQLLAVPMGSTRWGGRRFDDAGFQRPKVVAW